MIKTDVNSSEQNKNDVVMSREVFNQISRLTETVYSQQKTIESMENERKKKFLPKRELMQNVQM